MSRRRASLLHATFLFALVACSRKESTPESGTLGEVDLASKLPSGVVAQPNGAAHDTRRTVCRGASADQLLDVRVSWKSLAKDNAKYIASYGVDVVKPVPGMSVTLDKEPSVQEAIVSGTKMTVAKVTISCSSRPRGSATPFVESATIYIRADGTSSTSPTW